MYKAYEIVKGAPIPETRTHKQGKFPFDRMDVGDSFFVPLSEITEQAANNQCSKWGRRLGRIFRVRQFDDQQAQFWREA